MMRRRKWGDVAWAVDGRAGSSGADVLRDFAEAVRWPFERAAWAVENWLVWPIQEETAGWSRATRAAVGLATLLLAAAGVIAGLAASSSGGGESVRRVTAPIAGPPPTLPSPPKTAVEEGPVLHGAPPNFGTAEGGSARSGSTQGGHPHGGEAAEASSAGPAEASREASTEAAAGSTEATSGQGGTGVAGPAALAVAREFAGAFVLYETGRTTPKVRTVFAKTATPALRKALLRRPPRLPADVEVPKAKVVNVVAGPSHAGTYTVSVSLLRVGLTSELRLDMRPGKGGDWRVTDVRG